MLNRQPDHPSLPTATYTLIPMNPNRSENARTGRQRLPVRPKFQKKDLKRSSEFDSVFVLSPSWHTEYSSTAYIEEHSKDGDAHGNATLISSCSTNATMDDIPGTGRTLDMHFYQPVGRAIERFALKVGNRFNILHPPPHVQGSSQGGDVTADRDSINSFSTNATMDNIPGTGRSIDMHFYQPVGRAIEKFALKIGMRLNIYQPSPAQILRFFLGCDRGTWIFVGEIKRLNDMKGYISAEEPVYLPGVLSLVKQSQ